MLVTAWPTAWPTDSTRVENRAATKHLIAPPSLTKTTWNSPRFHRLPQSFQASEGGRDPRDKRFITTGAPFAGFAFGLLLCKQRKRDRSQAKYEQLETARTEINGQSSRSRIPVKLSGTTADARFAPQRRLTRPLPSRPGLAATRRGTPPRMSDERTTAGATASLPDTPPEDAYAILATPANWADLFLFASKVEAMDGADSLVPLSAGTRVRELAGFAPYLTNELFWVTTVADPTRGVLELESAGTSILDSIGARDARLTVEVLGLRFTRT